MGTLAALMLDSDSLDSSQAGYMSAMLASVLILLVPLGMHLTAVAEATPPSEPPTSSPTQAMAGQRSLFLELSCALAPPANHVAFICLPLH